MYTSYLWQQWHSNETWLTKYYWNIPLTILALSAPAVSFTDKRTLSYVAPIGRIDDITGECEGNFWKEEEMTLNTKSSRHFQVWWRVLFFKTWHSKDTPVSSSHWNDEKTKATCSIIGLQKSDKFTLVKVDILSRFLMHQWLEVFTTDLNIFEHVHVSVNIPTFHSALARFCGRSLFWFNFPHHLVQLTPRTG